MDNSNNSNNNKIICKKRIKLMGKTYLVYLKEVATKLGGGGRVETTTVRAFVKKI